MTCAASAACWVLGTVALAAVRHPAPEAYATYAILVAGALALLRELAGDPGPRRDERIVSALAILGRGTGLTVVLHLAMRDGAWPRWGYAAVLASLLAVTLGQARTMLVRGPAQRRGVPGSWTAQKAGVQPS